MVDYLLEHGADVNAKDVSLSIKEDVIAILIIIIIMSYFAV
jgi:hypothetical protein